MCLTSDGRKVVSTKNALYLHMLIQLGEVTILITMTVQDIVLLLHAINLVLTSDIPETQQKASASLPFAVEMASEKNKTKQKQMQRKITETEKACIL